MGRRCRRRSTPWRKGLAEWDAAVSRVEAGFAGAIKSASPAEAARMRATLAATYLDRGRVADAVPHLDQAVALDPSFVAAHLLRGLAYARLNRTAAAWPAAYAAARKLAPCVGTRVVSVSQRHSRGGAERGARRGTGGIGHSRQSGSLCRRGRRLRRRADRFCSTTRR
jgi:hypothetical protein